MTPWRLLAPCHESNLADSVFVQAVIYDPETRSLATYNPLVVDFGSTPAIAPVPLQLPEGAIIGIFGGGNDDLTILDHKGVCINGADGKQFGQVFFCNSERLFDTLNHARLAIPPLGRGTNGERCPSVRSFSIVDQDQSDNVTVTYLATAQGTIAQDNRANRSTLGSQTTLINGSDNTLLAYVDRAIGCKEWMIPDLTNGGVLEPTQATNEMQAAAYQTQPIALVPAGDPMVGPGDLELLNSYRSHVDQTPVDTLDMASTRAYCLHLQATQLTFINAHRVELLGTFFPPGNTDLYAFMLNRYQASLQLLGCQAA